MKKLIIATILTLALVFGGTIAISAADKCGCGCGHAVIEGTTHCGCGWEPQGA